MRDYKFEADEPLRAFPDDWTLAWVPRLRNTVADAACAQAVLCALNPWKPNRLDPFFPNKALVNVARKTDCIATALKGLHKYHKYNIK